MPEHFADGASLLPRATGPCARSPSAAYRPFAAAPTENAPMASAPQANSPTAIAPKASIPPAADFRHHFARSKCKLPVASVFFRHILHFLYTGCAFTGHQNMRSKRGCKCGKKRLEAGLFCRRFIDKRRLLAYNDRHDSRRIGGFLRIADQRPLVFCRNVYTAAASDCRGRRLAGWVKRSKSKEK